MKTSRLLISFLVFLLFAIGIFEIALARETVDTGNVAGVKYTARVGVKDVIPLKWTSYARAETKSSLTNPGNVGWYWWQSRELCGSTVLYYSDHGGAIDTTHPYTLKYSSYDALYHVTCSNHQLSSFAKFDFAHNQVFKSPIIEVRCPDLLCN
jgi:hypothetical protein